MGDLHGGERGSFEDGVQRCDCARRRRETKGEFSDGSWNGNVYTAMVGGWARVVLQSVAGGRCEYLEDEWAGRGAEAGDEFSGGIDCVVCMVAGWEDAVCRVGHEEQ